MSESGDATANSEKAQRKFDKKVKQIFSGILIAIFVSALVVTDFTGLVQTFELKTMDARHRAFAAKSEITDEIIIVDIDEHSIKSLEGIYGRFPWPRFVHGELVDYLVADGAKVIGFDVIFAERTLRQEISFKEVDHLRQLAEFSGQVQARGELLDLLDEMQPELSDWQFEESIKASERTIQAAHFFGTLEEVRQGFEPEADDSQTFLINELLLPMKVEVPERGGFTTFYNGTIPITKLARAATGIGHINHTPDQDGPTRRSRPFVSFKNRQTSYPSIAIAMAAFVKGVPVDSIRVSDDAISIGDARVPLDVDGSSLIRYQGGKYIYDEEENRHFKSFYRRVPYRDVIMSIELLNMNRPTIYPEGFFRDKIVLVGSSAAGLMDVRATPFEAISPGVEIHANVIDNILANRFLKSISPQLETASVFLIAMLVAIGSSIWGPRIGTLWTVSLLGLGFSVSWYSFDEGILLPLVAPALATVFSYLGVILLRYITEEKEKRMVRGAFGKYISGAVMEEVLGDPEALKFGGEKRFMTVLFSDVVGFTTLSEMLPPEEISSLLSEYLTEMVKCVKGTGGTLDKFIGDAVVAEWNAPQRQEDHAARACTCALRMMEELHRLQKKWKSEGKPILEIRIGINSGEMTVGNMGAEDLFDYTVIGDEVNTAARLEPLNNDFGTKIMISETTRKEAHKYLPDHFFSRELAQVSLKGRTSALKVYELIDWNESLSDNQKKMIELYKKGMRLYLDRKFQEAVGMFKKALELEPSDGPSKKYINICEEFIVNPPSDDWVGIYVQTSK
ncbi:MAG: adenylate/guanylate cyclase domain-containing protein [Candidatus Lindowbacteria bacterium]|nr:adenylate/guanylate cyclase domain-containing protein [Candidatus Lindowbacteria bacterium]